MAVALSAGLGLTAKDDKPEMRGCAERRMFMDGMSEAAARLIDMINKNIFGMAGSAIRPRAYLIVLLHHKQHIWQTLPLKL